MATGAAKTDTFLGARYRRLCKSTPKTKALAALERSILVIIFHLLSDPTATFEDLGADYHDKRIDKQRRTRSLIHQLENLGHHIPSAPPPDHHPLSGYIDAVGLTPERGSRPAPRLAGWTVAPTHDC